MKTLGLQELSLVSEEEVDRQMQIMIEADKVKASSPEIPKFKTFRAEQLKARQLKPGITDQSYLPFGNEGTICAITPFGELLYITKSLGRGNEGPTTLQSSRIFRREGYDRKLERVFRMCKNSHSGFGLRLAESFKITGVQCYWVNDCWPQITYDVRGQDVFVSVRVQFIVKDGTLFQQYIIANKSPEDRILSFELNLDADVAPTVSDINAPLREQEQRSTLKAGPLNCSVAVQNVKENVGATIALFACGKLLSLEPVSVKTTDDFSAFETDDESDSEDNLVVMSHMQEIIVPANDIYELTAAYKVQDFTNAKSRTWIAELYLRYFDVSRAIQEDKKGNWLHEDTDINFIFRRHLMHILHVCSIPISSNVVDHTIAFIDGDFIAPMVYVEATFSSFRYLLAMHEYLNGDGVVDGPLKEYLQHRIVETCSRHLKWCFYVAHNQDGEFTTCYPNGEARDGKMPGFLQGSLHMIKLFEFFQVFPDNRERELVLQCLQSRAKSWLESIGEQRHPRSQLWVHDRSRLNKTLPRYRLRSLVLLWKAVGCISEMLDILDAKADLQEISKLKADRKLRATTIRSKILERFICQESKEAKMSIAVSRQPEGNRFMFYATDTSLFDAQDWGFFETENGIIEPWKESMVATMNDRDMAWENLLRFGLELVKDQNYHPSLDKESRSKQLVDLSEKVILSCVTPSGLFHSRYDLLNRRAIVNKVHPPVSFALPYVLFCYKHRNCSIPHLCRTRSQRHEGSTDLGNNGNIPNHSLSKDLVNEAFTKAGLGEKKIRELMEERSSQKVKKLNSATFDPKRVNDPPEFQPDWMFDYPSFLEFQPQYSIESLYSSEPFIDNALRILEQQDNSFSKAHVEDFWVRRESQVIDIPKKEPSGKPQNIPYHAETVYDLQQHLNKKRIAKDAKKRLIYIQPCKSEHSLLLYLVSPPTHQGQMIEFLSRHKRWVNYWNEELDSILNIWNTEFHVAFYQRIRADPFDDDGDNYPYVLYHDDKLAPEDIHLEEWRSAAMEYPHLNDEESQMLIVKSAVGFRTAGDMHDRFWTMHVLVTIQTGDDDWSIRSLTSSNIGQRTVLESYYVKKMTNVVFESTKDILVGFQNMRGSTVGGLVGKTVTANESFDKSYERSATYLAVDEVLRNLQQSVNEVIEKVDKWEKREATRSSKPRWSKRDEKKYGTVLKEYQIDIAKNTDRLRKQYDEIITKMSLVKYLREALLSDIQVREGRISAQSGEDVRIFTYATVIFLPLSFASSLFSMAGAPGSDVIAAFSKTMGIALVITLVFVFNAKTINKVIQRELRGLTTVSRKRMKTTTSTWPIEWVKAAPELEKAERRFVGRETGEEEGLGSRWWYIWFWIAYICIEIPASHVDVAIQIITNPQGSKRRYKFGIAVFRILLAIVLSPFLILIQLSLAFGGILRDLTKLAVNRMGPILKPLVGLSSDELWEQKSVARAQKDHEAGGSVNEGKLVALKKEIEMLKKEEDEVQRLRRVQKLTNLDWFPPSTLARIIDGRKGAQRQWLDDKAEDLADKLKKKQELYKGQTLLLAGSRTESQEESESRRSKDESEGRVAWYKDIIKYLGGNFWTRKKTEEVRV